MTSAVTALVAFVLMEPAAAGAHRLVMHGRGWAWHRSHHIGRHDRVERNDRFPALFACLTVSAMIVGASTGIPWLMAAGAGVSGYGLAYLLVHDVCVHGRLTHGKRLVIERWLRWVASCHDVHHRTGAAPFGFLFPVMLGSRSAAEPAPPPLQQEMALRPPS